MKAVTDGHMRAGLDAARRRPPRQGARQDRGASVDGTRFENEFGIVLPPFDKLKLKLEEVNAPRT